MQFFLDSANLQQIEKILSMGCLDGVTTNPSLFAKEGVTSVNYNQYVSEILKIVGNQIPVSFEVISTTFTDMVKEGEKIASFGENVCVKLPITIDGIMACKELSKNGIKTNMTLCFSPMQALLVAKAGATYVSPFIGRLDDIGQNGLQLIAEIRTIFNNYPELSTQILSASIRNIVHLNEVAKISSDVATIPYSMFEQMVYHPLTDSGLKKFLADFNKNK
jgi:transaldolase